MKLLQVKVAYLSSKPRQKLEWKSRSYKVKARSIGEAEELGIKLLNIDVGLTNCEDYAVTASIFNEHFKH